MGTVRTFRRSPAFSGGLILLIAAGCRRDAAPVASPTGLLLPSRSILTLVRPHPPISALVRSPFRLRAGVPSKDPPSTGASLPQLLSKAGVALWQGRPGRATTALSRAVDLAPNNAPVRSDLAAAYLQASALSGDCRELILGLGAALGAVASDPNLPAAQNNVAVALARLGLADQAVAGWQILHGLEPGSPWVDSGMVRAKALQERQLATSRVRQAIQDAVARHDPEAIRDLVLRSPQTCREYFEEKLLVEWAAAIERGDTENAHRLLSSGRSLAVAFLLIHGEVMPRDILLAIDHEAADPAARGLLASALAGYGRALAEMEVSSFAGALRELRSSDEILRGQHNPLSLRVASQVATIFYRRGEYQQATLQLTAIAAEAEHRGYRALHGRCLWLLGLLEGARGELTSTLTVLSRALADFSAGGETINASRMRSYLAEWLDLLGQQAAAWQTLAPALTETATTADPATRFYVFFTASWLAIEQGELRVAARFQLEALRYALASSRPDAAIAAYERQAFLDALIGDMQGALASLQRAEGALARIADPTVRRTLEGDIEMTRGEMTRPSSPADALHSLDAAIRIFHATSYHYRIAYALYQRALANRSLGHYAQEESDLRDAVAETESQRDKVLSREERADYLDHTRTIFETMIELQLDRNRPRKALEFSEEIKARALGDWIVGQFPGPASSPLPRFATPDSATLLGDLPNGTTVIEYAALPDRLVIFVLRNHKVTMAAPPVPSARLDVLVSQLREALSGSAETANAKLESLYDLILRSVAPALGPEDHLVFVPDRALHTVPFAALRDSRTGRYLMEDHTTSVSPSAAIYEANLRRDRQLVGSRPPRALVVANPDFDRGLFPGLSSLPAASTEDFIARNLMGSRVIRGKEATKLAFLQAAPLFDLIHFAGHALVNREFPLLSQLLLAPAPGDPARGVLYSGELLHSRLNRVRLVVLASCSTGSGPISATEGVESIARPLLAAGVPAVVASLWDIDDSSTAKFMSRFYSHLSSKYDVPEALRGAQLDSLRADAATGASPAAWSAFEMIGGSAAAAAGHGPG